MDSFYLGKPTPYWSSRIREWDAGIGTETAEGGDGWVNNIFVTLSLRAPVGERPDVLGPDEILIKTLYVLRATSNATKESLPSYADRVPVLNELLADENERVRFHAAMALGRIGAEAEIAAPALRKLLQDECLDVRVMAKFALEQVTLEKEDKPGHSGLR